MRTHMQSMLGKREQNKARKRAEIVAIATRSFFERGYAATSMSAISEQLGGSKATLWAHFGSKEELFAAVVDRLVDTFAEDIDEVLTSQVFSIPALRRALLRFLDCLLQADSVSLFRLVLAEGERFPEVSEMFYARGPARVRECVITFFSTRFGLAASTALTQITLSAINGYRSDILLRPVKPTHQDHEAFIDSLIGSIQWADPA